MTRIIACVFYVLNWYVLVTLAAAAKRLKEALILASIDKTFRSNVFLILSHFMWFIILILNKFSLWHWNEFDATWFYVVSLGADCFWGRSRAYSSSWFGTFFQANIWKWIRMTSEFEVTSYFSIILNFGAVFVSLVDNNSHRLSALRFLFSLFKNAYMESQIVTSLWKPIDCSLVSVQSVNWENGARKPDSQKTFT